MKAHSEAYLLKKLTSLLRAHGFFVRRLQWIGRNSAPDLLVISPSGTVSLVEMKAEDGKLSEGQKAEFERIPHVPGKPIVLVCFGFDEMMQCFNDLVLMNEERLRSMKAVRKK